MYTAFLGFTQYAIAQVNAYMDLAVTHNYLQAVYDGTIVSVIHLGQYFS